MCVSCSCTHPEPRVAPCRSGIPVTTCAVGGMPSSAATAGAHRADHGARRHQGRELRPVDPGEPDQGGVVLQHVEAAVVGEPGGRHRHVRRGGHAGEPHREVVDRLEVPPGPARRPRAGRGRGTAGGRAGRRPSSTARRRSAGPRSPARAGAVALDRSADDHGPGVFRAPGVHPDQAVADRGGPPRRPAPCWPTGRCTLTADHLVGPRCREQPAPGRVDDQPSTTARRPGSRAPPGPTRRRTG